MQSSNENSQLFTFIKRVDFDTIIDHLALTHIIKSEVEPATIRIKRLLELISSYSFNWYYIKGKDMVLSDFLSRQRHDDSDPHNIIPISFNMHNILHEKYYNLGLRDKYLVQSQSQTKSSRTILPEVHGIKEVLDRNSPPEKHKTARQVKKGSKIKPRIGQGRVGIKWKKTQTTKNIHALTDKLWEIPKIPATQNIVKNESNFPMHEQSISSSKKQLHKECYKI